MIEMVFTKNVDEIKSFMIHDEELRERLTQDGVDSRIWKPDVEKDFFFFYTVDGENVGLIQFDIISNTTIRAHPCLLKQHRKQHSSRLGREMLELFVNGFSINLIKMVGEIPTKYPDVINWTKKLGAKEEAILKDARRIGGEVYDCVIVAMTREEAENIVCREAA